MHHTEKQACYNGAMGRRELHLGINASFVRKRGSGIGEVTYHALATFMRQMENEELAGWRITLYVEDGAQLPATPPSVASRVRIRAHMPAYRRDDLLRKVWWERIWLPRMVRRDACDALLSFYQCPTVASDVPHVMVVHDLIPRLFPQYLDNMRKRIYYALTEYAIRRADHIVTVSAQTRDDVARLLHVPPARMSVRHIAVDPLFHDATVRTPERIAAVRARYGLAARYIYFGGGLDMRKNAAVLIRAYARLRARMANAPQLVISGKLMPQMAPLITDVAAHVRAAGIAEHVRCIGFVPQEDLPPLYAGAAAFIYPSLYEGFGLPALEAISCGVPVVASHTSSLPEVVGDAALLCNAADEAALATAMERILTDTSLRAQLRRRARAQAARFTWRAFVRGIAQDITRVVDVV